MTHKTLVDLVHDLMSSVPHEVGTPSDPWLGSEFIRGPFGGVAIRHVYGMPHLRQVILLDETDIVIGQFTRRDAEHIVTMCVAAVEPAHLDDQDSRTGLAHAALSLAGHATRPAQHRLMRLARELTS